MQLSKVEGAKVQKEIPVDKVVVDVEADDGELFIRICRVEKGIADENLVVLQGMLQGAIIESVLKHERMKERRMEQNKIGHDITCQMIFVFTISIKKKKYRDRKD